MTSTSRAAKAVAHERWANDVKADALTPVDTESLRRLAALAQQCDVIEAELSAAVRAARKARRSWSEIGTMLGVSKQAAQRKYGRSAPAA